MQKENKVVVTQHMRGIETLNDEQNSQMQKSLDHEDQADGTVSTFPGEAVLTSA